MSTRITVKVETGNKTIKHTLYLVAVTQPEPKTVRTLIAQAAEACARQFPEPRSPYSDDLFKVKHDGTVTENPPHSCSERCGGRCDGADD